MTMNLINNGEVARSDFLEARWWRRSHVAGPEGGACWVRAAARSPSDPPRFGYRISYRRVLEVQARLLAAHLMGEIPDYVPFVTR